MIYLDANVLIALVEGHPPSDGQMAVVQALADGSQSALTSELSVAECLAKPYRDRNAPAVAAFLDLLSDRPELRMLPVTRSVLMRAARIRAGARLKLLDAIHLATALEAGCAAFVSNDRDFAAAEGIRVLDWNGIDLSHLS